MSERPRLNKFHKAEKAHVQYFFEIPNTPRAPPHISTLYVHPLYLNHDLSNFVGSEINFDTWFIVAVYLAINYMFRKKDLMMVLGGEKNKLRNIELILE